MRSSARCPALEADGQAGAHENRRVAHFVDAARMLLAGDIGGTKALLALYGSDHAVFEERYASSEFTDFESLLAHFLHGATAALGSAPRVTSACFGFAGPVEDGHVRVTNLPWSVDASRLRARFGFSRLRLVNDFYAAASGIGQLAPGELVTLQSGEVKGDAPRLVIGAGTGLGIAYVGADGKPLAGEGGHAAFAPVSKMQAELWQYLHEKFGRVTLEHVISGAGLARIYAFLRQRPDYSESAELRIALRTGDAPALISRYAMEQADALAGAALDLFIACYGAAAGDHALHVMARGGVFVAGGIAPKILPRLQAGGFIAAFNDKNAFGDHMRRVPVHVVTNERLGLLGAAALAQARQEAR